MSDAYTKLFSSITESTIWSEPAGTRLVWITLLAKTNRNGEVYGSVPGLARLANVTLAECAAALDTLRAPDMWSRTPDNEGRRIADIDGGWRLLNHAKFDRAKSQIEADERERERKREWDRKNRPSGHERAKQAEDSPPVRQQSDESPIESDTPLALALTPAVPVEQEQKQKPVQPAAAPCRFLEFWAAYPNKKSKQEAEKSWRKLKLDGRCDELMTHVRLMESVDQDWLRGAIPMGSTYLNQARWEDVPKRPPSAAPPAAPGKTMQALMALEEMKNGLANPRTADRIPEAALPRLGSHAGR